MAVLKRSQTPELNYHFNPTALYPQLSLYNLQMQDTYIESTNSCEDHKPLRKCILNALSSTTNCKTSMHGVKPTFSIFRMIKSYICKQLISYIAQNA